MGSVDQRMAMVGWQLTAARRLIDGFEEAQGTRLNLAILAAVGLALWALRIARAFVPRMGDALIEEPDRAHKEALRDEDPFLVGARDEDGGDRLQVCST